MKNNKQLTTSMEYMINNYDQYEPVKLKNVAHQFNMEIIGKKIHLKFNQDEFLLNINVSISSNLLDLSSSIISSNVEVNFLENKDNFSNQDWNNLYKLSEETFVEETDSLKQGAAGAGLTDND